MGDAQRVRADGQLDEARLRRVTVDLHLGALHVEAHLQAAGVADRIEDAHERGAHDVAIAGRARGAAGERDRGRADGAARGHLERLQVDDEPVAERRGLDGDGAGGAELLAEARARARPAGSRGARRPCAGR